jgi:hypothetical protein
MERMIKERLNDHIAEVNSDKEEQMNEDEASTKKSRLKEFLDNKEKRRQEPIEIMDKGEITCPDCQGTLYKGEKYITLCLCYGEFHNKNIKIKKNNKDNSVKLAFPKKFDIDNVEMLLDAIRNK